MKKLLLITAVMVFVSDASAQTGAPVHKKTEKAPSAKKLDPIKQQPIDPSHTDCVMMKDGKMMITRNGVVRVMKSTITLSDGTKIMTDGSIIRPDGTKTTIEEGNCIDVSSKLLPI